MTQVCGAASVVPGSLARPRVTLALFAYSQQSHVRAAVEGALAQDYDGPLEIILSDDGSPDATFAVMQKVARAYDGPHHVRLNRNDPNLGLAAHVNRVLAMAQGEIIVMAAGDDISMPGRVTDTVAAFARHPEAMAVSFADIIIAGDDTVLSTPPATDQMQLIDLDMFFAAGPRAQSVIRLSGASRAFRRGVWDLFGDLIPQCPAEDTPYLRRSLYLGPCIRCDWPGIRYRIHAEQMSTAVNIAKMNSELFEHQYLHDLQILRDHIGIAPATLRATQRHIQSERVEFLLRILAHTRTPPDLGLVLAMLRARGFSLRAKLGLVKRFILRETLT